MKCLINEAELVVRYEPGKGAWTYHLRIPGTAPLKGKWGDIKVTGTIDGYNIGQKNLMPVKGADKWLSINDAIRQAIKKSGGDLVRVTLYLVEKEKDDTRAGIIDCFRDAEVLQQFRALPHHDQEGMLAVIFAETNEARQVKRIQFFIDQLALLSAGTTNGRVKTG